jgi:Peptidase family M23
VSAVAGAGIGADALAASGGASPSGGVAFVDKPEIKAVKCVANCMSHGRVQGGGKIKLRGQSLSGVTRVIYRGGRGKSDDVSVRVRSASDSNIRVRVPMSAQSGRVEAWAGKSAHGTSHKVIRILPPPAPTPNRSLSPAPGPADPGAPELDTATSRSMLAIDQRGGVRFSFRFKGSAPDSAKVTLVRLGDGFVVKTWNVTPKADKVMKLSWNGLRKRKVARYGRYGFRLVASTPSGAKVANARSGDVRRDAFDLEPAVFPIKGKHNYGGAGNRFGAPRSGHRHQGQDVMAKCGTKLVAARGGVIKAKQYQSAAGYYLVINAADTGVDMAYMHLKHPSPYSEGDRVHTGDQIGVVGETGDATACHLHFEEWHSPGWYTGGSPFDPLRDLRKWDKYS